MLIANNTQQYSKKPAGLTILISFHSNRPSCFTCSANCTDLCRQQFPSLSNDAPSNAGLAGFLADFLDDDADAEDDMLVLVTLLLLPEEELAECDLVDEVEAAVARHICQLFILMVYVGVQKCCKVRR